MRLLPEAWGSAQPQAVDTLSCGGNSYHAADWSVEALMAPAALARTFCGGSTVEGVEAVTCSCSQSPRAASVCRMMLGACSSAGPLQACLAVPSSSAVGPACVMQ